MSPRNGATASIGRVGIGRQTDAQSQRAGVADQRRRSRPPRRARCSRRRRPWRRPRGSDPVRSSSGGSRRIECCSAQRRTTGGPMETLGTKCPSMTSTCSQSVCASMPSTAWRASRSPPPKSTGRFAGRPPDRHQSASRISLWASDRAARTMRALARPGERPPTTPWLTWVANLGLHLVQRPVRRAHRRARQTSSPTRERAGRAGVVARSRAREGPAVGDRSPTVKARPRRTVRKHQCLVHRGYKMERLLRQFGSRTSPRPLATRGWSSRSGDAKTSTNATLRVRLSSLEQFVARLCRRLTVDARGAPDRCRAPPRAT